jgi:choline dehydrogenase-like flavoprotein
MKNKHVNAIVVGAGAGGGIVAKELAVAGLSVVLFERGGWATYDDHDDDELISQRTTVLGNAFGPDDKRHRTVLFMVTVHPELFCQAREDTAIMRPV